jgi:nanoRNase/pAp phosphatase (c-di-AMP/oligoRNAs hydrolase)
LALQLVEIIKRYKKILVAIKGSPDPDAIASSYAFKLLCNAYGVEADIDSPLEPSLPQNRRIISDLKLPIQFEQIAELATQYDAYAVFDHQSVTIEGVTGAIPCAVHIDHHDPMEENVEVDFKLVVDDAGSACTLMIFLLDALREELHFEPSKQRKVATALEYGIQTDTNFLKFASDLDRKALKIIEPFSDRKIIKRIASLPFSKQALRYLSLAIQNQLIYKDWLISGIGYMDHSQRDTIAIIGDFLLHREEINTVVVFSIIQRPGGLTLDVSFRTKLANVNLNAIIKRITREGGGRRYKGAYQVDLDYFRDCPDRDQLWDLVYRTTVAALQRQRDQYRARRFLDFFEKLVGR